MKHTITAVLVLALSLATTKIFAQQFNISPPVVTEIASGFFQQQFTFAQNVESNTFVGFGLGNGFQAGINFLNFKMNFDENSEVIDFNKNKPSDNPNLLFDLQKVFNISRRFSIELGTQTGVNIASLDYQEFSNFTYVISQRKITKREIKILLGAFYTNKEYSGEEDYIGYMLGLAIPFTKKWELQADYLSGSSPLSVIAAGLNYKLTDKWSISAGAQIPGPSTDNDYGVILQTTRIILPMPHINTKKYRKQ
jgi:hypothetical protein